MNMELLLKYQSIDAEYMEFESKLKDTDTRKQMNQRKRAYKNAHDKLQELEQNCKLKNARIADLEKQLKSLNDDMEDLDKDISYYSECDDDELDAKEIKLMAVNAEKILDSITKVRKMLVQLKTELAEEAKTVKTLVVKLKNAKSEHDELKAVYEQELSVGEPRRKEFEQRLSEIESKLSPDVMKEYKRIKSLKTNPIAIFKDSRCSGCNMQLPSNVGAKISASDKPVFCENCGRILALPQD